MAEARRKTICNRDCPDSCGIVATIEDGRVTRIQGDPDHPVTRGFLCHRTNQFLRRQHDPARITAPLVRRGGQLQEASWDDALDLVAATLLRIRDESGPEAILHYRSGGTLGMVVAAASDLFFHRFGPVTTKRGDICSGAGEAAQELDFGACDSSALDDLRNAAHILVWGKNVVTSSPHTLPVLEEARAAGTELVLVDPVHHETRRFCDRFVQLRPAGDFALAMAVARVIVDEGLEHPEAATWCDDLDGFRRLARSRTVASWCEEADVERDVAEDLARRLHHGPTTILVGWGMARRLHGGAIVRALDALGAITGNVGIPGGQVSYYFQRRRGFASLVDGEPPRTIPEPLLGPEIARLDDPPIRAVWVTAANPVAMLPDALATKRALASRELTVVVDDWLSDTAEIADVVLPTTTLLEADDLLGAYGHHHVGAATGVVPPPAGVGGDYAIFRALSARVGLEDLFPADVADFQRQLLAGPLAEAGVTLERLREGPMINPIAPKVVFEGRRFPTPSGKARLVTRAPTEVPRDASFPLMLLSLSTPRSQSSQWAKGPPSPAEVTVHPDAAPDLDGAMVKLRSALGAIRARVRHDPRQRRDVALVPKGGHVRDGASANQITRARLTDLGEGGALYDEWVRIEPLAT
ncbi:MAG TPA: molybdopterin-containing oxidoreductase catalytic subunit [Polyangiaceae bacterium]|nr:molybdopterin-containing oxidoreductase catalytic subunit [Polyangiaceae bacterium]